LQQRNSYPPKLGMQTYPPSIGYENMRHENIPGDGFTKNKIMPLILLYDDDSNNSPIILHQFPV